MYPCISHICIHGETGFKCAWHGGMELRLDRDGGMSDGQAGSKCEDASHAHTNFDLPQFNNEFFI